MDILLLLVISVAVVLGYAVFLSRLPRSHWFIHPLPAVGLFMIGMPLLRGWFEYVEYLEPRYPNGDYFMQVLIFSTVFFIFFYAASWFTTFGDRGRLVPVPETCVRGTDRITFWATGLATALVALIIVGGAARGLFQTLGDERYIIRSRFDILIKLIAEFRWLLFGMTFVLYAARRTLLSLILLGGVWCLFLLFAVATGGRGQALIVAAMAVPVLMLQRFTVTRIVMIVGGAAFAVVLVLAITVARGEKQYQETLGTAAAAQEVRSSMDVALEQIDELAQSILARATIYPLEFQTMFEVRPDKGLSEGYRTGSFRDMTQVIPRILWPSKPYSNFNVFMSQYLHNRDRFNEYDCPIGRTTEAYYMFSWFGVLMGGVYGFAYSLFYRKLYAESTSFVARSIYIYTFFAYMVMGSSSMTARLPIVLQVLVVSLPLLYIYHVREKASPQIMVPQPV